MKNSFSKTIIIHLYQKKQIDYD